MPWYFPWSDNIKKRACRYLLQRFLGQFLLEKLSLDQLSVDLYNGKGTIRDVVLDVEALNELAETYNLPVEFVDGFISTISVFIPWPALLSENSILEVEGLKLTVQPKQRSEDASMFDSIWGSMTTSIQLAEECLRHSASEGDKDVDAAQPFEGLERFAVVIDSVLCRIKIKFINAVIRMEHVPKESKAGVAVEIHVVKAEYYDEAGVEEVQSSESLPQRSIYEPAAFSLKCLCLEGTSIFTDEFPTACRTYSRIFPASIGSSPDNVKMKSLNLASSPEMPPPHTHLSSESQAVEGESEVSSNPIMISRLSGKQEIRLRLKQEEEVSGPKVDVKFHFGPVVLLLSPRQVHILFELFKGIARPDLEDSSNILSNHPTRSKPMGAADYALVEQELQRQLNEPAFPSHSLKAQQGWSRHSLEDSDDEFLPMSSGCEMTGSTISGGSILSSDMDSSMASSVCSAGSRSTRSTSHKSSVASSKKPKSGRMKGILHGLLDDGFKEMTHFRVQFSTLHVLILHEDIMTSSPACPKPTTLFPAPHMVLQMRTLVEKFFEELHSLTMAGLNLRDFPAMRKELSEICRLNHLRIMASPVTLEGDEKLSSSQWLLAINLTVGDFELLECTSNTKRNMGVSDDQTNSTVTCYSELLSFNKDSIRPLGLTLPAWVDPALRVKYQQIEKTSQSRMKQPQTRLSIHMGPCHTEVDFSLVDRIRSLLNSPPLCVPAQQQQDTVMASCLGDEGHTGSDVGKFDINVVSPFLVLLFRFPIPDLRPLHDMNRPPWWQCNLHKEMVIFEISKVSLTTVVDMSETEVKYELQCKEAHGLFQEGPSTVPLSFMKVSVDPAVDSNTKDNGFDWPRVVLKVRPAELPSVLEAEMMSEMDESLHANSLDQLMCHLDSPEPSPFASRRVVYETESYSSTDGSTKQSTGYQADCDQVTMPGDKSQISDFMEKTANNTRFVAEFAFPTLNMCFPNKHFYEVLYNRISNDLLLWEPTALETARQADLFSSISQRPGLDLASHMMKDSSLFQTFSMCKSSAYHDSSSDSEEDNRIYYSVYEHRQRHRRKQNKDQNLVRRTQSKVAITFSVGQGQISFNTPCRDSTGNAVPGQTGMVEFHIEDGTFFITSSYRGEPNLGYLCFQANRATLFHCGMKPTTVEPRKVKTASLTIPEDLVPTIYRSQVETSSHQGIPVGTGGDSLDMLTVAVKVNTDETQGIKTFRVALGIHGATLRHQMSSMSQNWLHQFIDFFEVEDYPVAGYTPAAVVMELHLHLWDCAIDYRPLYLPLRSMLTLENFSVSSNITANTSTSVLRIIAEELCLFVSDKVDTDSIDLRKNYVCVVDTGLFDLTLRMTDGKDLQRPRLDLQAYNNIIHIRTCADSCQALQSLITYLASDGDLLGNTPTQASEPPTVCEEAHKVNNSLSKSQLEHVHQMVAEAMKESPNSSFTGPDKDPSPEDQQEKEYSYRYSGIAEVECDGEELNISPDDEFCILEDDPGTGIAPRNGEPQVRRLTSDPVHLVENHFSLPVGKVDHLKAPKHFPPPQWRYTLREMSVVWYMYGGHDFESTKDRGGEKLTKSYEDTSDGSASGSYPSTPTHSSPAGPTLLLRPQTLAASFSKSNSHENLWSDIHSSPVSSPSSHRRSASRPQRWQAQGGPWRKHNILIELQMNKVRFQQEIYPDAAEQASRQVLIVHDFEIRDRLAPSQINKFLYQYTSESMPRQSQANMIVIKALHIRPEPSSSTQECSLWVSVKPIRLNIDQDTLLFLYNFLVEICGDPDNISQEDGAASHSTKSSLTVAHQSPVMGLAAPQLPSGLTPTEPEHLLIMLQESTRETQDLIGLYSELKEGKTSSHSSQMALHTIPTYFRSFVFSPDVPVRLDYHGKRVDMEQGALAGLLMGLGQLNCSELRLKRLSYRRGLLGTNKLLAYALDEWFSDIKKNQLPSLLGGVGPMHSFVQLFQGIRDLFWLPVEQYRKDGRILRGIQKGANSFTTSTAMAFLELTNRLVQTIQGAAEIAYDMVSPGPSVKMKSRSLSSTWQLGHQPSDIREGMANAYHVFKEGLGDTARTLVRVASEEHEHKGMSGAVGAVLRQIPPTVVKPVILATEAASNVLGGVQNQLVPDARLEAEKKWRNRQIH